jgi:hypothetical protein
MHQDLVARLCAVAALTSTLAAATTAATAATASAAATAPEPSTGLVVAPPRATVAELPRTGVAGIDVARRIVTLVDGRRLRYDDNDALTLSLAYLSPDNVQFTTSVTRLDPTPAWYATVEGTHHRVAREVSVLRFTFVAQPSSQAKVRCAMTSGDSASGACARPEGTSTVTWTRAGKAVSPWP